MKNDGEGVENAGIIPVVEPQAKEAKLEQLRKYVGFYPEGESPQKFLT